MRRALTFVALIALVALAAPWLAPHDPNETFRDFQHAPPMLPRPSAGFRIHPIQLEDRLEQRYVEDRTRTVGLPWGAPTADPVFLFGTDAQGRDVLSRLLAGARLSLGLALLASLGALLIGALAGAWAGAAGGWIDQTIMRVADFILVLPTLYVLLVLRAVLPLVLPVEVVFMLMVVIFSLAGWPIVARGVRAIVARERDREHVLAARSLGAGRLRLLAWHLLPACAGHMAVQATLLVPAFILAEATLSFLGIGFPDTVPSWGTMLSEASDVNALVRFPWTLAPAAAIFAVTLATNIVLQEPSHEERRRKWRVIEQESLS